MLIQSLLLPTFSPKLEFLFWTRMRPFWSLSSMGREINVFGLNSHLHSTLEAVFALRSISSAEPHRGALWQHCKRSAVSYFSNRVLVPILRCLEQSTFHFSSSPSYLPLRDQQEATNLHPLPLVTSCCSYMKGGWRRKKTAVPSDLSILSLSVKGQGFKTSECAFPNANTFTGLFECNRLKIKCEVWNRTANLYLLLSEYCIVTWRQISLKTVFQLKLCFKNSS